MHHPYEGGYVYCEKLVGMEQSPPYCHTNRDLHNLNLQLACLDFTVQYPYSSFFHLFLYIIFIFLI